MFMKLRVSASAHYKTWWSRFYVCILWHIAHLCAETAATNMSYCAYQVLLRPSGTYRTARQSLLSVLLNHVLLRLRKRIYIFIKHTYTLNH